MTIMEEKYCTDTRFIYLRNEEKPSHMAFQRFISNKLKDDLADIFTEINEIIKEKDNVNTRVLCIDGSNWEANATKFSFAWRATAEKSLKKAHEEVSRTVREIEGLVNLRYTYSDKSVANLERYLVKLQAFMTDIMRIEMVYGKGKRKTPVQRHFDTLMSEVQKIEECEEKLRICGDDRNSYSKTDHDATSMHMKYDYYMHTGVFKPGYNVQCGICDEYIWHVRVGSERTDSTTFPSFMDGCQKRYGECPGIVTADAGYGSERNYMYCLSHGTDAYIKYTNYRSEKTAAFRKQQYRKENLLHIEDGRHFCPAHKEFRYVRDIEREKNGSLSIAQEYECEDCEGCPFKKECTRAKGNRRITINVILDDMLGQHIYIEPDNGQSSVKDGIWLDASYIVQDGDTAYVWGAVNGKLKKITVELGQQDKDTNAYEIKSGLKMEDEIAWPMDNYQEGVNVTEVSATNTTGKVTSAQGVSGS